MRLSLQTSARVGATEAINARARQARYYSEECDPEFEIRRPHGCGRLYEYLIAHKFATGLGVLGMNLSGRRVLEVCCGSGMLAEKMSRDGARVTGLDYSAAAIGRARERARRYRFAARFMVGDAEMLPFADRAFDVVAVHDGLHHLDDPMRALSEMSRVAREGVLVMEPARAALTRLAVHLGVAVDVEDAGNEVRRLVPDELRACLLEAGFKRVTWRRTLMYYPHEPAGWFRWFDRSVLFLLLRAAFRSLNGIAGRWGNKLTLAAARNVAG